MERKLHFTESVKHCVARNSGDMHQTAGGCFSLRVLVHMSGAYSEDYLRRCS